METWSKYLLFIVTFLCVSSNAFLKNAKDKFYKESSRIRRQAGYVYDRPNVSFNLPTDPVTSTTARPISNVDRMPSQMYYAYPVPTQTQSNGAVSGSSKAGSTPSTSSGYNYQNNINAAQPNQPVTNNVGYQASVSSVYSSPETGYNYANQNTQIESNAAYNAPTSSGTSSGTPTGLGYTYKNQNQPVNNKENMIYTNTGSSGTRSDSSTGYNYAQNTQLAQTAISNTANAESSATVPLTSSSDSGYNYNRQNTEAVQSLDNNVNIVYSSAVSGTTGSTSLSEASGYNYGTQNTGNESGGTNSGYANTASIADKPSSVVASGYNYQQQSAVTNPATNNQQSEYSSANRPNSDVSTNAPEYLPPTSSNSVSANVETAVNRPTLSYLPPEISSTRTTLNTQTTPIEMAIPTSNYLPSTSTNVREIIKPTTINKPVQQPALGYLPTNTQTVSNIDSKQNYNGQPVKLPVNTYIVAKASPIPTPASTYLPPV